MRHFIPLCFLITLAAAMSCEKFAGRYYRSEVLSQPGKQGDSSSDGDSRGPYGDTSIFVLAVVPPKDYDWRRDSAYGTVSCDLLLFKNGEPVLSLRTGAMECIGTDPDSHHLIGGHIYTEYASVDRTVLKCDGRAMLSFSGRERLIGMLVREDAVYTMGKPIGAEGFTLRRNEEIMLHQDEGVVFGSFSSAAYGRTGALYEHDGKVCFCFRNNSGCFVVRGGVMESARIPVSASRIRDMRIADDGVWAVADYGTFLMISTPSRMYSLHPYYGWAGCQLVQGEGSMWYIGDVLTSPNSGMSLFSPVVPSVSTGAGMQYPGRSCMLYTEGGSAYCVSCDGGDLAVHGPDGDFLYGRDSTLFLSRGCGLMSAGHFYLAITPKERDVSPFLWKDGEEMPIGVDGYLTGVDVVVSPPM